MPPNFTSDEIAFEEEQPSQSVSKAAPRTYKIVYWNILVFLYYHIAGIYGIYLGFTSAHWATVLFSSMNFWLGSCGIIAGGHRLWTHRSYKATKPLQLFLMLCHTIANQHSVIHWARDHRLHHKYSDTDADPHNATRGFFFSHVGWLFVKKHEEVKKKGEMIDISDLYSNPFLRFQHRHNFWFIPLISFIILPIIPMYFWGETFTNAWNLNMARYIINLNLTLSINSFAHMWGYRPYDKHIAPTQHKSLFYLTLGEGFHNYHHVFPWDYRSDELGYFSCMTSFIDLCASLGLAFDRRVADKKTIEARVKRTGDASIYS